MSIQNNAVINKNRSVPAPFAINGFNINSDMTAATKKISDGQGNEFILTVSLKRCKNEHQLQQTLAQYGKEACQKYAEIGAVMKLGVTRPNKDGGTKVLDRIQFFKDASGNVQGITKNYTGKAEKTIENVAEHFYKKLSTPSSQALLKNELFKELNEIAYRQIGHPQADQPPMPPSAPQPQGAQPAAQPEPEKKQDGQPPIRKPSSQNEAKLRTPNVLAAASLQPAAKSSEKAAASLEPTASSSKKAAESPSPAGAKKLQPYESPQKPTREAKEDDKEWRKKEDKWRAAIYKQTDQVCKNGFYVNKNGEKVNVDVKEAKQNTASYTSGEISQLPLKKPDPFFKTTYEVVNGDTLNVLLEQEPTAVGINMANRFDPGGGVVNGRPAQEESLCRRGAYMPALVDQYENSPIRQQKGANSKPPYFDLNGCIYSKDVPIFREDQANNFAFMNEPKKVNLCAVAAYDLRQNSQDRIDLGFSRTEKITKKTLLKNDAFIKGTTENIRNMLKVMAHEGNTTLVLGALGCGAFETPPELIAEIFKDLLQGEFKGQFKKVIFAIYDAGYDEKDDLTGESVNIAAFKKSFKPSE